MTDLPNRAPDTPARGVVFTVLLLTMVRTVVGMTRRFTYAFVPQIARALGVPDTSIQNAIALQGGVALSSPLFGSFAEKYGRRLMMLTGLCLIGTLGLIGAAFPVYGVFLAMMVGFGLGKMLYDPAAIATLGDRVPFHRRAAAIGVNEFSWAASLMTAAPLTGLLLERATLSAVFLMLAVLNFLGALAVWWLLPNDRPSAGVARTISLRSILRIVSASPAALGMLAFGMFNNVANEMIFINYGVFMQENFRLPLAELGALTLAISLAEVLGEGTVAGIGDRLGPKRLAMTGMIIAAVCCAVFPLFGAALPFAVGGIFLMFLGFETAVVGGIPLMTEVLPQARASMLAAAIGFGALGRLTGGVLGGLLYANFGPVVTSLAAAGSALIALYCLARWVRIEKEKG